MLLHEALDDAVADVHADLPGLVSSSRRRGLGIRRRRRALATVGGVAAAAVLVAGVPALVRAVDAPPQAQVATDAPAPLVAGPLSGRTAPIDGRTTAAALAFAVDGVAAGTFGGFQGAAYAEGEAFAAVRFLPDEGSGPAGLVFVNVQPLGMAGGAPYTCAEVSLPDCRARELANGDLLRTYRDDDSEMGAGSERLAAELISPDRRLRLVVSALNTNPYADGEMRDAPVLTTAQLVEIATAPWWDRHELPTEFVGPGERLQDYTDAAADES